jgi:hypothetical protein
MSTHFGSVVQVDDVAILQVVNGGPVNYTVTVAVLTISQLPTWE